MYQEQYSHTFLSIATIACLKWADWELRCNWTHRNTNLKEEGFTGSVVRRVSDNKDSADKHT